jgi:hypothetical protein
MCATRISFYLRSIRDRGTSINSIVQSNSMWNALVGDIEHNAIEKRKRTKRRVSSLQISYEN